MIKNRLLFSTLIIGASFLIQSCKITEQTMESQYREVLGVGTSGRIEKETNAILARHQYAVIRTERSNDIYYETGWAPRLTFPDEVLAGVSEVKTRIIIRARPSNRGETTLGGGAVPIFSITFEGQTEYSMISSTEWQNGPLTESRYVYFKEIAYQFRSQFSSGGIRN